MLPSFWSKTFQNKELHKAGYANFSNKKITFCSLYLEDHLHLRRWLFLLTTLYIWVSPAIVYILVFTSWLTISCLFPSFIPDNSVVCEVFSRLERHALGSFIHTHFKQSTHHFLKNKNNRPEHSILPSSTLTLTKLG